MAEINDLDVLDASNTARWPENMAPSAINNAGRAGEGILARFHEDLGMRKSSTGSADAYVFAAAQTLSAYYDGLLIGFDANFANTGAATIAVDGLAATTIKKYNDQDLASGDIESGQKVLLVYDGTNFQMLSPSALGTILVNDLSPQLGAPLDTNSFAMDESEGSAVASAATADIWATDGNTVHITGTTTITSLGTAARIGAWRRVIFDGVLTLTDGANLNLPGGANITTAADDFAFVYAETTTLFKVLYFKVDGTPVVASAEETRPSFSVHRNGTNQTAIVTATYTKVQWTTEEFDTNSDFDNATNYRFTPTVAGKYILTASSHWGTGLTDGSLMGTAIYKNGTIYKEVELVSRNSNANGGASLSVVADANGTTDYFEVFVRHSTGTNEDLSGSTVRTFFTGMRIGS